MRKDSAGLTRIAILKINSSTNAANKANMMFIFESVKNPKNPRVLKKIIEMGMISETGYTKDVIIDVINPNISATAKRLKLTNRTTEMSS